jgi:hypothetical protein
MPELGVQVIQSAMRSKQEELSVLERNVATLSCTARALQAWLEANEPRVAAATAAAERRGGGSGNAPHHAMLRHEDVIVASDALSRQALKAQARAHHAPPSCWWFAAPAYPQNMHPPTPHPRRLAWDRRFT